MNVKNFFLITILSVSTLSFTAVSNAAIIDNGSYTSDSTSGLDWLDWSLTDGMTGANALAANSGWRYATSLEASSLMNEFFWSITYDSNNFADLDSSFKPVYDSMASLFGVTCPTCSSAGVYAIVNNYGLIGSRDVWNNDVFAFNGYGSYNLSLGNQVAGIALVRSSAALIPEPSIIALMGLGLFGIGLSRRQLKK